ncbi:fungal-specific transcription factor domain-containing protein [Chlamydoabsidia padenii]|nr:fungal-specific transcription factor domain-containing protein [Chlamydoabsidia padenii]
MSSDHEEGGNKRQRVSRACDLCRRKKIRCDGLIPICSNCNAFDLECTYKDTTKKRGPPKGYIEAIENRLYKLEGLLGEMAQGDDPKAKSLLKELSTPLETPTGEQIFNKPQRRSTHNGDKNKVFLWQNTPVRPKAESSSSNNNDIHFGYGGSTLPSSLGACAFDTTTTNHRNKLKLSSISNILQGAGENGEAGDSTGQLAMDANGQYRYLGKSSGFYLLQKSRTYHHGAFHLSSNQQRGSSFYNGKLSSSTSSSPSISSPCSSSSTIAANHRPTTIDPYDLPSPRLSTILIRLYFQHFYPVLPIFYQRQLSSSLDDPAEPISPLLLNAIYAVASRVCDDVEVRSDPARPETAGEVFFERAKCLLDSQYDIPRISTVQALLLLSSHQQGTMKSARAWLYSGMAFRMALDLGLNRNCDHWQIPADEKERRKRVFWCSYACDIMASATYGRSSIFEESDCDIPFPTIEDNEIPVYPPFNDSASQPGPLLTLSHLVKICDILGHVLKNIYYAKALKHADIRHIGQIVSSLTGRLSHWYKNLPPALAIDESNNPSSSSHNTHYPICVAQLHMVYHTTVILLHRLFIPNNTSDLSPESISEYNTCAVSATAIMNIANRMLENGVLKYVFHTVVYFIFTAGIIFINSASSSNDASKSFDAKVNISNIMRLLEELEKTWTSASRSANILGELAGLRELNLPTYENTLRPIVHQPQRNNHQSNGIPPVEGGESRYHDESRQQRLGNDKKHWNQQHTMMMGSFTNELAANSDYTNRGNGFNKTTSPQLSRPVGKGNMDPFAAPDTIPVPSQRQFDLSGAAFWGVPPSLDMEEWSHYLGTQLPTYQQYPPPQQQKTSQPVLPPSSSPSSSHLIPSRHLLSSPTLKPAGPFTSMIDPEPISSTLSNVSSPGTRFTRKHLIHSDANVDVLSGMPLDLAGENTSHLLGLLGNEEGLMTTNLGGQQQEDQPQGKDGLYRNDGMIYY